MLERLRKFLFDLGVTRSHYLEEIEDADNEISDTTRAVYTGIAKEQERIITELTKIINDGSK